MTLQNKARALIREIVRAEGIGSALLQQAENWCRERGARHIELEVYDELEVNDGNDIGRRFWAGRGFKTISQTMRKSLEVTP